VQNFGRKKSIVPNSLLKRDICFSQIKEPEIIILSEPDSVGDEDVFRGLLNSFYTAKLYAKDSKALRFDIVPNVCPRRAGTRTGGRLCS